MSEELCGVCASRCPAKAIQRLVITVNKKACGRHIETFARQIVEFLEQREQP